MTKPAHALLSASGSKRWLSCPPSARLEETYPDKETAAAREGTLAHAIGEFYLKYYLKHNHTNIALPKQFKNQELYNKAMLDYVFEYVEMCIEKINTALSIDKTAYIAIEEKIDYSEWAKEGFGTGDLVIITDKYVEIVDLKYGKGVAVSAVDNTQMQMYALGIISNFGFMYDFDTIQMTIFQPRNGGISSQEKSVKDLIKWGENIVKPTAELAYDGIGEFNAGKWCLFCRASLRCKKYSEYCLSVAKYDFIDPEFMSDEEMADALNRIEPLIHYAKQIKDYALSEALQGRTWPGYKLVEGKSSRKYSDTDAVIGRLQKANIDSSDFMKEPELKSITELTKLLGKKTFSILLDDLITKISGKPTLVNIDDPRPEYNSPENDFEILD